MKQSKVSESNKIGGGTEGSKLKTTPASISTSSTSVVATNKNSGC